MANAMTAGMMSSNRDDWTTPRSLFSLLDGMFQFTLDPCSNEQNHLCDKYYTVEDDGLIRSWKGERVFMNPPYGADIGYWCEKAKEESMGGGALIVGLVPARTDTKWWQDNIEGIADVIFIRGRLKFGDGTKPAPFPSAIVLWWGKDAIRGGAR